MSEEIIVAQQTAVIPNAQNLRLLAADMFNSRMFKGVDNTAQAVAIIQFGSELGLGPVTALTQIKIIQGQMAMSARSMLGLAQNKAGVSWKVKESTEKRCVIVFSRPKWEDMEVAFTIEEARAAGLLRSGSGWEKYPQDMLFARAASRGMRRIAPDAISGLYSIEEMQDAVPFKQNGPQMPPPAPEAEADDAEIVVDGEEVGRGPQAGRAPERANATPSPTPAHSTAFTDKMKAFEGAKKYIGNEAYYTILGTHGVEHANEIKTMREMDAALAEMRKFAQERDERKP
jgi:hypothetical protein